MNVELSITQIAFWTVGIELNIEIKNTLLPVVFLLYFVLFLNHFLVLMFIIS